MKPEIVNSSPKESLLEKLKTNLVLIHQSRQQCCQDTSYNIVHERHQRDHFPEIVKSIFSRNTADRGKPYEKTNKDSDHRSRCSEFPGNDIKKRKAHPADQMPTDVNKHPVFFRIFETPNRFSFKKFVIICKNYSVNKKPYSKQNYCCENSTHDHSSIIDFSIFHD